MGKSRRTLKIGSDNIDPFLLYGTTLPACQGADCLDWYREEGLSEHEIKIARQLGMGRTSVRRILQLRLYGCFACTRLLGLYGVMVKICYNSIHETWALGSSP
jgi:hypothetical protein